MYIAKAMEIHWFLYPNYFVLLALGSHDSDVDLSYGSPCHFDMVWIPHEKSR